jgi:hypothetical protein
MSTEARRNALALVIAAFVVALLAAFVIRPAVVLPVSDHAVASSLDPAANCVHAEGGFRCVVNDSMSSNPHRELFVEVGWDGCWRARNANLASPAHHSSAPHQTGCIQLGDY